MTRLGFRRTAGFAALACAAVVLTPAPGWFARAAGPAPAPAPAASPAASSASVDATGLLRASIAAPRSISYVGQLETLSFGASRSNATIVRVEHRAPDRTRRWYLAPEALYGDYTVTNGPATYQFDTKHDKLTVSHTAPSDGAMPSDDGRLDLAMANYHAVAAGTDTIAGHPTQSILLINRFTGERAERIWIDDRTKLVLKKESYHSSGAVASQTRFEELRYTDQIPDAIFATTAPTGYAQDDRPNIALPSSDLPRVEKEANFAVRSPANLPQGFKLIGGDVASVPSSDGSHEHGVRTLHLVYSDGIRSLSLFENATGAAVEFGNLHPVPIHFESHTGQYVEDGPTTLLTWEEHGISFALVGDLQRPELIDIAKSVIPGF